MKSKVFWLVLAAVAAALTFSACLQICPGSGFPAITC